MKKLPWYLLPVLLMGVVVGVLVGRWDANKASNDPAPRVSKNPSDSPSQASSDEVVMSVEAVNFVPMPVLDTISANGIIAPASTAEVSPRLTGAVIEQVLVDVGDVVKAGQVLAVVDNSTLKNSVIQSQADLAQAGATLEKAKADLARVEPLLAIDAVSRQEVDSYRTALRQAEASVVASQARLDTAQTSLNNSHIISPVSGVVSAKTAQVGTQVSGTPLFSIIKDGQLEWQATLEPAQASKIALGQPARLIMGEAVITGKVARLSPIANNARDITVHVALPSGTPLKSGMYQTGEFILSQAVKPAVPMSALLATDGYEYVLALSPHKNGTHKVSRVKVIAGERQGQMVALDLPEGFPLDALLVRQSGSFLNDGDTVKVASTPVPTSPAQQDPQETALPISLARPDAQTQGQ